VDGTPEQLVSFYLTLAELGMNYFLTGMLFNDVETLELVAEWVHPELEARISASQQEPAEPQSATAESTHAV
jgi:hypothetical protein